MPGEGLERLRAKAAFICDMDGALFHGSRLPPGAKEFVAWLNGRGGKFLFLTNSSERSPRELQQKLARAHRAPGLPARGDGDHRRPTSWRGWAKSPNRKARFRLDLLGPL
jgi:hypothetical protein